MMQFQLCRIQMHGTQGDAALGSSDAIKIVSVEEAQNFV
jgi:hypothetical protein